MKAPWRMVAAAALSALLVAACGSSESGDDGAAPAASGTTPTPAAAAPAGPWTFTDGSGKTVEVDHVPTRIIAHAYSAASLMEYGIKPIAIWADMPVKDDPGLKGVDLTGIPLLGEAWGQIDVEKAATLKPDLIVADYWPVEKAYSGMEDGVEEKSKKIAQLAPVVGATQGDSIIGLLDGYTKLAASLGADVETGAAAKAKTDFDTALTAFKAAAAAKPDLTALAISPYDDQYAVAVPKYAPELLDFQRWGLKVIDPTKPDPDFPYWQSLSFEKADTYQPDLLLFDDRNYPANEKTLEAQPIAKSIKAYAAGATTTWPAYWLHTYADYARELTRLTQAISTADPSVGD